MNKSDLADPFYNKQWMEFFEKKGAYVLEINAKSGAGIKSIQGLVQEACKEKIERDRKRGIVNRTGKSHGGGNSQCGKIHIYQCICRKGLYKDRK